MQSSAQFRISSVQDTLVAVWAGEPTVARLSEMVQALRSLHATHLEGVHLYNLITTRTGIPNKPARDLMARQFEAMRGKLISAAIVLEHSGVQYTLSRAVIGTLLTMTRNPFALKIFEKRDAAGQWLSTRSRASSEAIVTLAMEIETKMGVADVSPGADTKAGVVTPRSR